MVNEAVSQVVGEEPIHILLFDSILERHVPESLARALAARGHLVTCTGPVWQGWDFPSTLEDRRRIEAIVDTALAGRPDVVLNFRAASMLPETVDRFRRAGVRTAVWFPDDPVLYETSTSRVVDCYDVLLHCGDRKVLELYRANHGRCGVTFPFWADEQTFRYAYDPANADIEIIFVGNTHSGVRRWRYDWMAASPLPISILGKVQSDPAGIHAGYADSSRELARTIARARFGLNIAQQFRDYRGTEHDFPALTTMGEFFIPSRVLQIAAVGLPVISLHTDSTTDWNSVFPEVLPIANYDDLRRVVHELKANPRRLRALSRDTHARFRRHYTAASRAAFLEALLLSDVVGAANLDRRTRLFLDYPVSDRSGVVGLAG